MNYYRYYEMNSGWKGGDDVLMFKTNNNNNK